LDAGAYQLESLHFVVRAYGSQAAREVSQEAEEAYNRIMVDTNLFSFKPRGLYQIVVYATPEEYRRKTGQPSWSAGISVGNAIYGFLGPQLTRTIAHEMTHLIFYEYMGRVEVGHRWINEGLAVYEANKASGSSQGAADIFAALRGRLRQQPIPIDQLTQLIPATEREHSVNTWYAQSEAMVRYMIERGGKIGFAQFLEGLRERRNFDLAIASAFPGVWRSLAEFEQGWLRSLQ
jgi:hypothetical protein